MQLTRFTDYSLRVLIYLGMYPGRKATIQEISRYLNLSKNHLMKIVNQLSRKGYIKTSRGKSGGIQLARPPELINIGELVHKTEGNLNIAECFHSNTQTCPLLPDCPLKSLFNKALNQFMETLKRSLLADMIASPVPIREKTIKVQN